MFGVRDFAFVPKPEKKKWSFMKVNDAELFEDYDVSVWHDEICSRPLEEPNGNIRLQVMSRLPKPVFWIQRNT